MNKNIEVINKNLWAVNYSLIPFISEIKYTPVSECEPYTEFGRLLDDQGIVLLNKEHAGYILAKESILKAMQYSNFKLSNMLRKLSKLENKTPFDFLAYSSCMVELERRNKVKSVKGR